MNYEEKYKKALEGIRELYNSDLDMIRVKRLRRRLKLIFPELKESKDERIRKEIISFLKDFEKDHYRSINFNSWIAWLEKQGEKDYCIGCTNDKGCVTCENGNLKEIKIEQKFKVGDWVILNGIIAKILDKQKYGFVGLDIDGKDFFCNYGHTDSLRLWTIKDAGDGDVLVNWNNTTFIFKAIEDETVKFHIAYNENWGTIKTPSTKLSHLGLPEPQFEFHPATKEQRDLLFEKMKEAGYEWDSEKKELKKIESKKLDADKMIEWLKNTIRETKEYFGEHDMFYNTRLTLPYNSIEDLINDFKEDFGL